MFRNTLSSLACPRILKNGGQCRGSLSLGESSSEEDVEYGTLHCESCSGTFPILHGVAILVPDVRAYLLTHAKGISKVVPRDRIPKAYRKEYMACLREIPEEHIEEDLESDRVNSLYLMNHYLKVKGSKRQWWKSGFESDSPEICEWIEKLWDSNPMERISEWIPEGGRILELGCGVGGLFRRLSSKARYYLGVDSSFHSIVLARNLNLNAPLQQAIYHPKDLLYGNEGERFWVEPFKSDAFGDFVVGEMDHAPVPLESFDGAVSLNAIDMLMDPEVLPILQRQAIKRGGFAIQSGPYIWHERVASNLRRIKPEGIRDSAAVVEWLYTKNGFTIKERRGHLPWLFFKHLRQIELYSVHAFLAEKI